MPPSPCASEETARSTRTLIDISERGGEVAKGSLRRSTLGRQLDKSNASRRMMLVPRDIAVHSGGR
jgi:hypothetical protein